MNDNLMYNGREFLVLDSKGLNYKKNVTRRKMIFGLHTLMAIATLGLSGAALFLAYNIGIKSPASLFLTLGSICGLGLTFFLSALVSESYDRMINAENSYNLALAKNQNAILQAKEEFAQHEQNLRNLQYEKEVTFTTPMERHFTK